MKTLATLRLDVRERLGELEADFFSTSEVDRAINEAQKRFSGEERWPWLWTEGTDSLLADENTLDLPASVPPNKVFNVAVLSDSMSRAANLERVDPPAGFRLRSLYTDHQGAPRWYYLVSVVNDGMDTTYSMRFVPEADVDYAVEYQYVRVPDDLTAENDTADVPDDYVDALPAWAAGMLFLKELQISQKAQEQFALYGQVLDQARREFSQPGTDQVVAWGREHPGEQGYMSERDYIMGRINPTLGA